MHKINYLIFCMYWVCVARFGCWWEATGVTSVRCSQKIPPCPTGPMPAGFKIGQPEPAVPNWPKGCSRPCDVCSAIKTKRMEKQGGICYYDNCLLEKPLHILKLCFLGSGWILPDDVNKRISIFFCLHTQPIFFFLSPVEEGNDRATWWALGINPPHWDF